MSGMAARLPEQPAADGHAGARAELEPLLERVEQRLEELQTALSARDMPCIELHASELQRTLAAAVERFVQAARRGGVPQDLRRRLGLAGARIAAQRDALARATAALDRAIDVLMPGFGSAPLLYSASGSAEHRASTASVQA